MQLYFIALLIFILNILPEEYDLMRERVKVKRIRIEVFWAPMRIGGDLLYRQNV